MIMRSQGSSHKKQVSIIRIIKTPIRAISKALDLYARGATNFSNTYNRPLRTMVHEPTSKSQQQLPRSFTTSRLADFDQPPEGALVRSISTAATGGRAANINVVNLELYIIQHHRHQLQSSVSRKGVPRSRSVGMGKIDEDRVSSFRKDNIIVKSKMNVKDEDSMFSRSRSYDRLATKRSKLM